MATAATTAESKFRSRVLFFAALLLLVAAAQQEALASLDWGADVAALLDAAVPRRCSHGTIGECLGAEEMDLDSEINRRILATKTYISYGALRSNTVPCNKRGNSYYNCRSTTQANPYRRSCTRITRCARDTS